MGFQESFSGPKNEVKHRLTWRKPKWCEPWAGVGGERVGSTGSCPRSEPHVAAGGSHHQEAKKSPTETEVKSFRQSDPLGQSQVLCRVYGSVNDQERADVDGGEVDQTHPHLASG